VGRRGYTEALIQQEWKSAGLPGTASAADVKNWMKYGTPGQLQFEHQGGMKTVGKTKDGNTVQQSANMQVEVNEKGKLIHKTYTNFNEGITDWVRGGATVELGGDWKGKFGKRSKRMKFHEQKGRFFLNKEAKSHGLIGTVFGEKVENTFQKAIPKEAISGAQMMGGSTAIRLWAGEDLNQRGYEKTAELTGLKTEEVQKYTAIKDQIAVMVAAVVAAPFTGGASLAFAATVTAGVKAIDYASQDMAGMDVDWAKAGTDIAITAASSFVPGGPAGRAAFQGGATALRGGSTEDALVAAGSSLAGDWAGQGSALKTSFVRSSLRGAHSGDWEAAAVNFASSATVGAFAPGGDEADAARAFRENESSVDYLRRISAEFKEGVSSMNPFAAKPKPDGPAYKRPYIRPEGIAESSRDPNMTPEYTLLTNEKRTTRRRESAYLY